MHNAFILTLLLMPAFFLCGPLPVNPNTDPDNAAVTVTAINGQDRSEPFGVTAGDSVSLTLHRTLPIFIDSVTVAVALTEGKEMQCWHLGRRSDTTDEVCKVVFFDDGTWRSVITAHVSNGGEHYDTVIFTVAPKKENHRPVIKGETLPFFSDAGTKKTHDLAAFVDDSDSDVITFMIIPDLAGFILFDSKLTGSADLDTGIYRCTLIVSDGVLCDSAELVWRVLPVEGQEPPIDPDDTPPVIDDPDERAAIVFDNPETLIVINESTLRTVHYTAVGDSGVPVILSIAHKPSFVTGSISEDGITLTVAPDYAVVSSVFPEIDSTALLMASQGKDTLYLSIQITVRNVNRPPVFSSFPSDTPHVQAGSTFLSTPISGTDPDNDAIRFILITEINGLSIAEGRKIQWQVPLSGFTVGQHVPITVRVTDGAAFTDRNMLVIVD